MVENLGFYERKGTNYVTSDHTVLIGTGSFDKSLASPALDLIGRLFRIFRPWLTVHGPKLSLA